MTQAERILLLHDGDSIGDAVARHLRARGISFLALPTSACAEDLVAGALGSRAIIAVGDHVVSNRAVLGAAEMPGVKTLVAVVRGEADLSTLKKQGVPYTVLRVRTLLEEVVAALSDVVASGWLILGRNEDVRTDAVSADDVAECAIAATSEARVCGQVLSLAAPESALLSEIATRVAHATGRPLKVSTWPNWAVAAVRALNRSPFLVPSDIRAGASSEDVLPLHPTPWRTVEAVAADLARRNAHAMGMQ